MTDKLIIIWPFYTFSTKIASESSRKILTPKFMRNMLRLFFFPLLERCTSTATSSLPAMPPKPKGLPKSVAANTTVADPTKLVYNKTSLWTLQSNGELLIADENPATATRPTWNNFGTWFTVAMPEVRLPTRCAHARNTESHVV